VHNDQTAIQHHNEDDMESELSTTNCNNIFKNSKVNNTVAVPRSQVSQAMKCTHHEYCGHHAQHQSAHVEDEPTEHDADCQINQEPDVGHTVNTEQCRR